MRDDLLRAIELPLFSMQAVMPVVRKVRQSGVVLMLALCTGLRIIHYIALPDRRE